MQRKYENQRFCETGWIFSKKIRSFFSFIHCFQIVVSKHGGLNLDSFKSGEFVKIEIPQIHFFLQKFYPIIVSPHTSLPYFFFCACAHSRLCALKTGLFVAQVLLSAGTMTAMLNTMVTNSVHAGLLALCPGLASAQLPSR